MPKSGLFKGFSDIMKKKFYKKIYSHIDFYKILVLVVRSEKHLRLNRKKDERARFEFADE